MLYCELAELYPILDNEICCQDCPEFSFCPVVMDVYPCLDDVEDLE